MRGRGTQTLTAVRAAAALRAHGQGGYLGECIQGERTALRQAVHPNGTPLSSTVSLAVMRHFIGGVRTFLTLNQVGASEATVQAQLGPLQHALDLHGQPRPASLHGPLRNKCPAPSRHQGVYSIEAP